MSNSNFRTKAVPLRESDIEKALIYMTYWRDYYNGEPKLKRPLCYIEEQINMLSADMESVGYFDEFDKIVPFIVNLYEESNG